MKYFILVIVSLFSLQINAQKFSKITGKNNEAYRDSISEQDYGYVLPFMGEKVRKAGYTLPEPAGIMVGWYMQEQNLTISNLAIGIGDGDDLVNIDDWTDFEEIKTKNVVYSVRPDVWILPFLNVYGIYSRFNAITQAKLLEPIQLTIPEVEKTGEGVGFGTVLVYGMGPVWISENFTMAWSKAPGVDQPTQSVVNSVRIGTQVESRNRKHYGTIWVGTNYQNYVGSNTGAYDMTQLLPDEKPKLEELRDQVQAKIEDLQNGYDEFCSIPGNKPACLVIDQVLNEFKDRIEDKLGGITKPDELLLRHGYNVEPEKKWNMSVGAQYNFNKNWEARFEAGLLGRRTFMFSVNRRFGLVKKKG